MVTLKSESDTTDDDYTIEGGHNFSELDYKVKREILPMYHSCKLGLKYHYTTATAGVLKISREM